MLHWLRFILSFIMLIQPVFNISINLHANQQDFYSISINIDAGAPVPITDFIATENNLEGSIKLDWTAPLADLPPVICSGAVDKYIIEYASFSIKELGGSNTIWWNHPLTLTAISDSRLIKPALPGSSESYNLFYAYGDEILPGLTYYFAIKSKDTFGNISDIDKNAIDFQVSAYSPDFIPVIPNGLNVVSVSSSSVTISWNDMSRLSGYLDFDYYKIYRSSINDNYVLISTTTRSEYIDLKVDAGTTYYYKISAIDKPPLILESELSFSLTTFVLPSINYPVDTIRPMPPFGIKLTIINGKVNISWNEVFKNEDGTIFSDKEGYKVYRSKEMEDGWKDIGLSHVNKWVDNTITLSDNDLYYYKVKTVDIYGNESIDTNMIYDTSLDLNMISFSEDKKAIITVPGSINGLLYKDKNLYEENIYFEIKPIIDLNEPNALCIYEYCARKTNTKEIIKEFKFEKSKAKIKLKYAYKNNYLNSANFEKNKDLGLFWYNGIEWIKIGKELENGAISVYTSRLGKYMIKQSVQSDTFVLTKVYPQTFTPDGDNRNDYVEFQFDNPQNGSTFGKIYDLRGALVGNMKKGSNYNPLTGDGSLIWDGRTISGETAPAGVYIYQIEVTGQETKTVNGIVVLAK